MSWVRRNRWWLVVLPVAALVLVAASSYRVKTFWWDSGLHHVSATSEQGDFVHVVQDFEDQLGPTRRTFDVRLDGIEQVEEMPSRLGDPQPVPTGVTAWRVGLSWKAEPDQDLFGCRVLLVDAKGARYGDDLSNPLGQTYPCVPEETPGPSSPLTKGDQRGRTPPDTDPRPSSWTSSVVVMVEKGVRPREAWVTFGNPDYVVLPVS